MGGKVVQLVQGREKALEGAAPDEMLRKFSGFPVIQVIDLDAAIGSGSNEDLVEHIAGQARTRVGGGVRTPEKARRLIDLGVERVIVGTAAFNSDGPNRTFLAELTRAVPRERVLLALDSKDGRIVVKGWRESLYVSAEEIIHDLEPWCGGFLCTYVDKEGMMQGTDLDWFRRLRASTSHEITAAGGITTIDDIRALDDMQIHSALGMAIYTGRLDLEELSNLKQNTADLQSMDWGRRQNRAGEGAAGQDRPRLFVDDGERLRD
jgi:phosphoribosylformimino-5-aminoimidazole carboxamide ribotide isomerase